MCVARVLVVHPPVSVARDFIDYPYFADLGALSLVAVLDALSDGSDGSAAVTLVDAFAIAGAGLRWAEDGRAELGAPRAQVFEAIDAAIADEVAAPVDFVVVALTPFHRPPHRDDRLAPILAHLRGCLPEVPIVLADLYQSGQHYVEASGELLLSAYPEVDAWLKYEAEVSLPAMVARWRRGQRPRGVFKGTAPPDLDALPTPAWGRIDLDAYQRFHRSVVAELGRSAWSFPIDGRTLPLVTSRGCPFDCLHCSSNPGRDPGVPKIQRRLSAEHLKAAMTELREVHGASRVAVLDELINVNKGHFEAFLTHAEALDLSFEIPNGMRADYLERGHFERMRGRISTVSVSAESGASRVVSEVIGKRLDLDAIVAAATHAAAVGVPFLIHYIIGLPGESAAEINQTLSFALDLWDRFGASPAVQFATPLPGTRLADRSVEPRLHLPVAGDWGPYFQRSPTPGVSQVPVAELQRFMWTFRQRLAASQGSQKLVMNVTYICNNHCTFCAVGTRTQIDGHPTRQREHLDRYRREGVTMVDFDGGEPTLNPELIPLIRYSRAIGYRRINVTTNGRLCYYEDYARKLVRSGLTTLLFSVHGADPRTHAQQVGVAEAYEQTVGGIRHCVRFARELGGQVELGMNVTLTKGNAGQQQELANLAWQLGLRWMNIQFLTPFGRATRMIAPDTEEAAAGTRELIDTWGDRMKIQVINLPFCFLPGYEQYLQGDLAKLSRHMVFVNNESVNLAAYLAERRSRRPVCESCPHACFCGGFYELDQVPEPPWLIDPQDLVRSIDDPRRHESVPAGFRERVDAELRGAASKPKPS